LKKEGGKEARQIGIQNMSNFIESSAAVHGPLATEPVEKGYLKPRETKEKKKEKKRKQMKDILTKNILGAWRTGCGS